MNFKKQKERDYDVASYKNTQIEFYLMKDGSNRDFRNLILGRV